MVNKEFLDHVLHKMVDNKRVFSAVLCVENGDRSISWTGAAGKMQKEGGHGGRFI